MKVVIASTIMLDTEVYLEKIALLGSILRKEGMEVSPKETADACSILLKIDMDDRETVKTALRAVYAKSREEQLRFNRIFDSFFLSEDAIRALDKKHQQEELAKRQAMQEAENNLAEQTPNVSFSEEQKEAYSQLSQEAKDRLAELTVRFSGRESEDEALYANFIRSVFMKSIMEQQMKMDEAAVGAQAIDPEFGILFRSITDFQDHEIPKAVRLIEELAARINGELTRKTKVSGKSSALDFRRTIRKGLETGGSFYHLAYKRPSKKRKQLLILCDVSGSMIQFSEFALRLIQALNQTADNSRVILFSEESAEADSFHLQNMDLFRSYVKDLGIYGRGTNLGPVLKKINDERPSALSTSTVLILLSDGKSIGMDKVLSELQRSKARAGKIFCLNPLAKSKWKYSSSILSIANECTMLSCSTLNELADACRRLTAV